MDKNQVKRTCLRVPAESPEVSADSKLTLRWPARLSHPARALRVDKRELEYNLASGKSQRKFLCSEDNQ
jgi:hypothetical protein